MSAQVAAVLLGVGAFWTVTGVVLVRRAGAVCGSWAVLAGVVVVVATASGLGGSATAGGIGTRLVAGLCLPLVLATFLPRPGRWQHPAEATLVTAGVVGVAAFVGGRPTLATAAGAISFLVLACHGWWRLERADQELRRALLWVVVGLSATAGVLVLSAFALGAAPGAGPTVAALGLGLLPASLLVATSRSPLDPRVVTVKGVEVAGAVLVASALFVLVLSALSLAGIDDPGTGVVASVAVGAGLVLHPVRVRLRHVVDELLFGSRPDPLAAAASVAEGITAGPDEALRTIRDCLVLPYVAVVDDQGVVACTGTASTVLRRSPLPGTTAELVVGLRPGELTISSADAQVLRLVTPLLGQLLQAQDLTRALGRARAHTRAMIEEERRRLRRDLHDGLGSRLTGVALTADAVANVVDHDSGTARELVQRLRRDVTVALEDVRQLVYGMRPPALDEVGLAGALERSATELRRDGAVRIDVHVQDPLPPLPAAVEVAALRIATEAMVNVARHSGAARAEVRLVADEGSATLTIDDDGPAARPWSRGVGLSSMLERALECGGSLVAGPTPQGGQVVAVLPLELDDAPVRPPRGRPGTTGPADEGRTTPRPGRLSDADAPGPASRSAR